MRAIGAQRAGAKLRSRAEDEAMKAHGFLITLIIAVLPTFAALWSPNA
jgi:hypothetical protein